MGLKRKIGDEFVVWRSGGHIETTGSNSSSTSTSGKRLDIDPTPVKKARPNQEDPYTLPYDMPASTSKLSGQVHVPAPAPTSQARPSTKDIIDAPKPEKRGAIFKKKCPQNILERVDRVTPQRFYMLDRQRNPDELKETFGVLGSTGNVYTVTIGHTPSCNCPDAMKGNHCKHILFIFLKVLQVPQSSGSWYQKALLTSELEAVFAAAPLAPNALAHPRIREAHARATGKVLSVTPESSCKKRIPGPGDDCPICYEGMHEVNENLLVFCDDCGNALHGGCFQQWRASTARGGKDLTCVWCRAKWLSPATKTGAPSGAQRTSGGYLNLADVSGVSPVRDTSSYYHGPARGRRYYGYRDYDD